MSQLKLSLFDGSSIKTFDYFEGAFETNTGFEIGLILVAGNRKSYGVIGTDGIILNNKSQAVNLESWKLNVKRLQREFIDLLGFQAYLKHLICTTFNDKNW